MSTVARGELALPEPPGVPPTWEATIRRAHHKLARRFVAAVAAGVASFVVLVVAGAVAHGAVDGGGGVEVAIADARAVAEPDGVEVDAVDAVFLVSLSAPADEEVTVEYETVDETATGDEDYEAADGTLVFEPGQREVPLAIRVITDGDTEEGEETFRVELSDASNADIAAAGEAATGTIVAKQPVQLSVADARPVAEPREGETVEAVFVVSLAGESDADVTVAYETRDDTAVGDDDYERKRGTLTFGEGETEETVRVRVLSDEGADEGEETFRLVLSDPSPNAVIAAGEGRAKATIEESAVDLATISIADAEPVREPDVGEAIEPGGEQVEAVFVVSLSDPAEEDVTVEYETEDGTATADADYRAAADTLRVEAGESQGEIRVLVLGDRDRREGDETFQVVLSNPSPNAEIESGKGEATGTIVEEEARAVEISIDDAVAVTEPDGIDVDVVQAVFPVVLSGPSEDEVTAAFETRDGSATAGADYEATAGQVTFQPGETEVSVVVNVFSDEDKERDETFSVVLTGVSGNAEIADGTGTGTIEGG